MEKTIRLLFHTALFISVFLHFGQAQNRDLKVYPYWQHLNDPSNILYETLSKTVFSKLEERWKEIASFQTKDECLERQNRVRLSLKEVIGDFPEKTPLNPVVTGILHHDGMVIEKLYFESRPGYYVTAIFCYPEGAKEGLPAILYCSGHSYEGFRSEVYQHNIFNYVKKGFAVLAFDPIGQGERIRYLEEDRKPRFPSPTREHSYYGSQSFMAGMSLAHYFIWDGIRAVDYLLTRKEVDPYRLGITGRSGGGTQTAFIAAVDERLHAAAPECYITTYDKLFKSKGPQDAEQNLVNGIARGIDMADFIEVRAPKPTLIISTTRDIFSIQGARDVYGEAKKFYSLLGYPENLEMAEDDAPHESTRKNREHAYSFFRKHLNLPGDIKDEKVTTLDPEELWVTKTGNVYWDLGGKDVYDLTIKDMVLGIENNHKFNNSTLMEKIIELTGYCLVKDETESIFSGRTIYDDYAMEKYLLRNRDYYLPLVWLKPKTEADRTILLLTDGGKENADQFEGLVDKWLKNNYSIVLADLSGMGELGGGYSGGDARIDDIPLNIWYAGIHTGESLVGIHAHEINNLRQFIRSQNQSIENISVIANGVVCLDVLHAAYFDPADDDFILIQSLGSYGSLLENREYDPRYLMSTVPGGLQYYEIGDLAEGIGENKIWFINPVTANNEIFHGTNLDDVKYFKNKIYEGINELIDQLR